MLSEEILFALNDIDDDFLEETHVFMAGGNGGKVITLKRAARTLLIAAIITALLTVTAFAIYRAVMAHRDLKPDDDLRYYLHQEGKIVGDIDLALNHGDCAMALSFTTENPGHAFCFRMTADPPKVGEMKRVDSFLGFLRTLEREGGGNIAAEVHALEQSLQEADFTEEEAEQWNNNLWYEDENGMALKIRLYNGAYLADHDLILGWPKGEASVEREETWNGYHLLEVVITTEMNEDIREVRYLYLFQPEQQVLLEISAREDAFSFRELEQIAETVEVRETDVVYTDNQTSTNWSMVCFAAG